MDTRIDITGYDDGDEGRQSASPDDMREEGETMGAKTKPTHTPPRSVRVPNELWHDAQDAASDRGETVSEAILRFLNRYVKDTPKARSDAKLARARETGNFVESWHCPQPQRYRVIKQSWDTEADPPVRHVYEVEDISGEDEGEATA